MNTMNFDNFIAMRKLILIGLFCLSVSVTLAQETEPDQATVQDSKAQERIKNLRIAYISDKLGLTPDQAEKFWPVYRQFVQERAKLRMELKSAQLNINPSKPDPIKQQELIELGLRVKQRELDLEKEYSGRLLKVINAQQVLNLHKAEQEFRSMIINQLQQRRLMQERKENFRDKNQLLKEKNK
jgi:hypothetical protein